MPGRSGHNGGFTRLRDPDAFDEVKESGNFRSVTVGQLLMRFGIVFDQSLPALWAVTHHEMVRFPTMQEVQMAGDALFQKSRETDRVDFFISHSWRAERWEKYLALCMFFNLSMAIKCAALMWLTVASGLIALGGWLSLGGSLLGLPCLVYLPMAAFFAVFFWGQQLSCGLWSPVVWLDRLCVHQSDLERKEQQIASLPVFVAHSSRMLVLWDDTYFDRLWCHLELATFARYGGVEKVDVLPLWLAPWLLASILLDLLSASLLDLLEHVFPNWSAAWMNYIIGAVAPILGQNQALQKFAAWFIIWMICSVVSLPASIPSFYSFRMKLRSHQLMLQQMAEFDVRAAKCTVAADRQAVQQQVQDLFRSEHPWSTREGPDSVDEGELCTEVRLQTLALEFCDPLDRFNTYIRGTLRESVIAQIGNELEVPWQMCLAAFLPMIFYSSVNILGCDNGPCLESARLSGYSSVGQYMVVQTVGWALCIVMAFPLTYPILLRMVKLVLSHGDGLVHQVLACTCCPLAFEYSYVCGGLIWAALVSLVESYSATQLIVFLVIMAVLAAQVLCLFCGNSHHKQASCRCVRRQAAAS